MSDGRFFAACRNVVAGCSDTASSVHGRAALVGLSFCGRAGTADGVWDTKAAKHAAACCMRRRREHILAFHMFLAKTIDVIVVCFLDGVCECDSNIRLCAYLSVPVIHNKCHQRCGPQIVLLCNELQTIQAR